MEAATAARKEAKAAKEAASMTAAGQEAKSATEAASGHTR